MHYPFLRAAAFLDDWLAHQAANAGIIGLAVAIHHKEQVVFNTSYGWADIAKQEKLTTDHLFCIGSLSKMITASAIILLAQQQKLSLDHKAVHYLPWLAQHRDDRMVGITINQLLTHRSGLARDGALAGYWQLEGPFPDPVALQKLVLDTDITLDGYAKFKYSNLGYALLGQIIEAAANQPYSEFVQQYLFNPIGMSGIWSATQAQDWQQHIATGYTRRQQGRRLALPGFIPANTFTATTGWYANTAALCSFLAWHFSTASPTIENTLKNTMHHDLEGHWQPANKRGTTYGQGFMRHELDGRELFGHGGGFFGHRSYAFYDPAEDIGLVLLSNTKDAPLLSLARGIFNTLDFFLEHDQEPAPKTQSQYNAHLANLWTELHIVATTKKIAACNLDNTLPFSQAEELAVVGPQSLKIIHASDISSEGELVHFEYQNGALHTVNYAGQIFRPATAHAKWVADRFGS